MRVGFIEFTAQDTRLEALLAPDVAWHSPSHELKPSMKSSPADAVVFHVKLDDRADIADALKDAAATNPRVRMLLAASSSQAVLIANPGRNGLATSPVEGGSPTWVKSC